MPKIVKSGIVYSSGSTMPAANIPYTPPSGSGSTATTAKAAIDEALTGVKNLKSSLSTTNGNVTSVTKKADANASNITSLTTRMGSAETKITNVTNTVNSLNTIENLITGIVNDSYTSDKKAYAIRTGHVVVVRGSFTVKNQIPAGSSFTICDITDGNSALDIPYTADAFARTTTSLLTSIESNDSVNITPTTVTCMLPCAITLRETTLAFSNANDVIPAGSTITFTMVYIAK